MCADDFAQDTVGAQQGQQTSGASGLAALFFCSAAGQYRAEWPEIAVLPKRDMGTDTLFAAR